MTDHKNPADANTRRRAFLRAVLQGADILTAGRDAGYGWRLGVWTEKRCHAQVTRVMRRISTAREMASLSRTTPIYKHPARRGPRLTLSDTIMIRRLHADGWSVSRLAREFGVVDDTIRRRLRIEGVTFPSIPRDE